MGSKFEDVEPELDAGLSSGAGDLCEGGSGCDGEAQGCRL